MPTRRSASGSDVASFAPSTVVTAHRKPSSFKILFVTASKSIARPFGYAKAVVARSSSDSMRALESRIWRRASSSLMCLKIGWSSVWAPKRIPCSFISLTWSHVSLSQPSRGGDVTPSCSKRESIVSSRVDGVELLRTANTFTRAACFSPRSVNGSSTPSKPSLPTRVRWNASNTRSCQIRRLSSTASVTRKIVAGSESSRKIGNAFA